LLATNWHVVDGAREIRVEFSWQKSPSLASLAIKDPANDLAILRIDDLGGTTHPCSDLPYELKRASSAKLGEKISTIGYPLEGVLGAGPKYTEGSISGLTGLMDDVRHLQISAPVQPGNSGGPLIDESGDVIGIIVSMLNPTFQYQLTSSLPQNVNFAIKADYLLSLVYMLPNKPKINVKKLADPSEVAGCVGVVRAIGQ
jgi:S1-C subfamily serine protease